MKAIAIDIGSSFIKCCVIDTRNEIMLNKKSYPMPPRIDLKDNFRFEIDPELILKIVFKMINEQIIYDSAVRAILFSVQMHGYILTHDGIPISNYISWQDSLAAEEHSGTSDMQALHDILGVKTVSGMGTRYKAGLAICSLFARQRRNPIELDNTEFHTLGGYLIYRLSGRTHHACHITSATATGFVDALHKCWNQDSIHKTGLSHLSFPEIVDETTPLGNFNGIPLFSDIGDHQASVYGTIGSDKETAILTIGTAAILSIPVKEFVCINTEVRPFFHERYLVTRTNLPGGRILDTIVHFYEDVIQTFSSYKVDQKEIWAILWGIMNGDSQGLQFDPSLYIGPGKGAINCINSLNLNTKNLFEASITSLASAYSDSIKELRKYTGDIKRLVLSGGKLALAEPFRQRIEQIAELPVTFSPYEDVALIGLIKIARQIEAKL